MTTKPRNPSDRKRLDQYRTYRKKVLQKHDKELWNLSFEDWCDLWDKSGKYEERGTRKENYVLIRKQNTGPFTKENMIICIKSDLCPYRPRPPYPPRQTPFPMQPKAPITAPIPNEPQPIDLSKALHELVPRSSKYIVISLEDWFEERLQRVFAIEDRKEHAPITAPQILNLISDVTDQNLLDLYGSTGTARLNKFMRENNFQWNTHHKAWCVRIRPTTRTLVRV